MWRLLELSQLSNASHTSTKTLDDSVWQSAWWVGVDFDSQSEVPVEVPKPMVLCREQKAQDSGQFVHHSQDH